MRQGDCRGDDALGAIERVLYLAAALTGLRQGELLALKWLDIDWQIGRVRVADNFTRGRMGTPKSHEGRSVPMAARLARELDGLRQRLRFRADRELVFCHPDTGHVLDPSKMRKRFKDALARASVHEITFHALRHTFGTQMAPPAPRARHPGVGGSRRRKDDRDLPSLCSRSVQRGGFR